MTTRTLDMANVIASDVTIAGDKTLSGDITFSGDVVPSTPLSHRNLIINGAMQIFQRGTSAVTAGLPSYDTADRWRMRESTDGTFTSQKYTMSVSEQNTTGHAAALQLNCTGADTSIASAQYAYIATTVEAQNCQHLQYGTASAKTLTLSFWVKSNKTGTYTINVRKQDTTQYVMPIEYTISSADTWEQKTINISPTAGSTSLITSSAGTIVNDNGEGLQIGWSLAWGSNYHATNNTWTSGNSYSTSNQINWMDNTSNNFYITGVQLELGDNATPFEHRTLQDELLRCQRYFYLVGGESAGNIRNYIVGRTSNADAMYCAPPSAVPMRSTPTVGNFGSYNINCINKDGATNLNTQPVIDSYDYGKPGNTVGNMYLSGGSGLTDGRVCCARLNAPLTFDSEL